jgi:hypothetical protein
MKESHYEAKYMCYLYHHALLFHILEGNTFADGPKWMTRSTPLQLMPIPKAMVQITTLMWFSYEDTLSRIIFFADSGVPA